MDKYLRFCMITTFYPPYNFGGDGIFVRQLANELAARGHHVEVIHCIDAYRLMGGPAPTQPYHDHPNIKVHGLKSRLGSLSPLATQQTGRPLFKSARIRQILAQGFDVIHYHNISLIGPKVLEYGDAIKLYTMHEFWLVCPTHVLFKFNREVCTRRDCFACGLTYKRPPQWWRHSGMLQSAIQNVDAFIAPSRFSKDMHNRLGFDAPVMHLPNFVSGMSDANPLLARRTENQPAEKPYFLFVGRLEKLKGLQTIISLFQRYVKAELWIAGAGKYEPHLRQLVNSAENVRFLGNKTKDELQVLYRNAIALVVPSICLEVFPLVVLEAFLQRTPAIVRNIGGLPEIIHGSGGGFVYDTEAQLLCAMEELLSDKRRRDHLCESGFRATVQKWSAEAHLASYLKLIGQIAASRYDTSPNRNVQ
jgi:glycosyltransferase involved in cell wall biosynthesis